MLMPYHIMSVTKCVAMTTTGTQRGHGEIATSGQLRAGTTPRYAVVATVLQSRRSEQLWAV